MSITSSFKQYLGRKLTRYSNASSYFYGDHRYGNYNKPKYHYYSLVNWFGVKLIWGDKYSSQDTYAK